MKSKGLILLLAILLLHILSWFALKPVAPKTDDLVYTSFAKQVIHGEFHLTESPKNHRVALIYPVAALLKAFGENPFVISLFPLLCSLCTICILFFFLVRCTDLFTAGLASVLLAVNTIQITFSAALFPDVVVSMYMLICVCCVFIARNGSVNLAGAAIMFVLSYVAGFLTKEIIVLAIPFFAFLFVKYLLQKKNLPFWKIVFAAGFVAVAILILYYKNATGDWKFIYHTINKNHNDVFVPEMTSAELFARYTYGPLIWLAGSAGFIFLLILSIPEIIRCLNGKQTNAFARFITLYFLFLLAAFWFGTTSITRFAPVLLYERMWLPLLAPLCILCGLTISRFSKSEYDNWEFLLVLILLLAGVVSMLAGWSIPRAVLFGVFAVVVAGAQLIRQPWIKNRIVPAIVMVCPFLLLALYFVLKNSNW